MTLGEAKTRALHLIDEISTNSSADAYLAKFYAFLDMAQREIATGIRPIVKYATLTIADADDPKDEVPTDAYLVEQVTDPVYLDQAVDYYIYNGYIYVQEQGIEDGDTFAVKYRAWPTEITSTTADSYEFEIDADAQDALPFYAAANAVMMEDQNAYAYLMGQYTNRLANLQAPKKKARIVMRETGAWL